MLRLGYGDQYESKGAEEEVNEYLSRAIDARNTTNITRDNMTCTLTFRRQSLEDKVSKCAIQTTLGLCITMYSCI